MTPATRDEQCDILDQLAQLVDEVARNAPNVEALCDERRELLAAGLGAAIPISSLVRVTGMDELEITSAVAEASIAADLVFDDHRVGAGERVVQLCRAGARVEEDVVQRASVEITHSGRRYRAAPRRLQRRYERTERDEDLDVAIAEGGVVLAREVVNRLVRTRRLTRIDAPGGSLIRLRPRCAPRMRPDTDARSTSSRRRRRGKERPAADR